MQYPAKCLECGRIMRPGTPVESIKDGGRYIGYVHQGKCPPGRGKGSSRRPDAPSGKPIEELYDLRECSNTPCMNAVGVAYPKGEAPTRCERCGSVLIDSS